MTTTDKASIDHAVKEFWDAQATEFKDSQLATNPDSHYRAFEIDQVAGYIRGKGAVLDVGCGNGFSTFEFARRFPKLKIVGVDYSQEMIDHANASLARQGDLARRVSFRVGDVLTLSSQRDLVGRFDQVISERCVINLLTWAKQRRAILEMKKMLKPTGEIILCENTQEGLGRLNALRQKLGLFAIQVRWHNRYLREKELLPFARKTFRLKEIKNIGSMYYVISRVVYAKLADMEQKTPEYSHPINAIARQLPPAGDFSPNHIFLLGNKR